MLKKYILMLIASLFLTFGSISAEACGCSESSTTSSQQSW